MAERHFTMLQFLNTMKQKAFLSRATCKITKSSYCWLTIISNLKNSYLRTFDT